MMWRTHFVGGIAALWLLVPLSGNVGLGSGADNLGLLAICAGFGALLPDLDASDSHLQHFSVGPKGYGVEPFASLAIILHQAWGHRGPLHSAVGLFWTGLLLGIPLLLLMGWHPAVALLLGYASHLALDAMTRTGIPFYYPDPARRWVLPAPLRVATGSAEEDIVFAVCALAAFALAFSALKGTG